MSEELTTALLTAWPNIPPLVAKRLTTEPPSDDDEGWEIDAVNDAFAAADAFHEIATLLGTDHPESMARERTIARVKELLR